MSFYKRRAKPQPSSTGGLANATESGSTVPPVSSTAASSDGKSSLVPTPTPASMQTSQQTPTTSGLNIRLRTSTKDAWNPFASRQTPTTSTPMVSYRLSSDLVAVESPAISAPPQSTAPTATPTSAAPTTAAPGPLNNQDTQPEVIAVTQVQTAMPQDSAAIRARRPGPLVLFHRCQAKNPVLGAITQVPRAEGRIACDYECSPRVGVVYVSARFHVQKPEYAPMRLGLMGRTQYMLKILLVLLDVELAQEPLMMLTLSALAHNHTVICASSTLEAARYLELLATLDERAREDSSAFQTLMGKVELGEGGLALELLKSVRGLTKNSILGALKEFKSFAGIATADVDELCNVHGMGQKRASKLHALMHEPFR